MSVKRPLAAVERYSLLMSIKATPGLGVLSPTSLFAVRPLLCVFVVLMLFGVLNIIPRCEVINKIVILQKPWS